MRRVAVWAGDGKTYLGKGQLVGDVKLYCFRLPNGSLSSSKNPEVYPSEELIEEMASIGGVLDTINSNPKIVLDNGDIVYGCQTWWKPLGREIKDVNP